MSTDFIFRCLKAFQDRFLENNLVTKVEMFGVRKNLYGALR